MKKGKMPPGDLAAYYFHQGTSTHAYDYLGVHRERGNEYIFRVYAPAATEAYVSGDFNGWSSSPMIRVTEDGVWEARMKFSSDIEGAKYKFRLETPSGPRLKADPYARYSETEGRTASIVYTDTSYVWGDERWMQNRPRLFGDSEHFYPSPMNIYELHLGSWKRSQSGEWLNYRDIARELVVYLRQMGYTHVELLPVAEHPLAASWGYQVCGFYAPTSRFGDPNDFRAFVDILHRGGIGVILDWVPAHFPKDEHGLGSFDGTHLYEYDQEDRRENRGWGTYCFNVGRTEVQSFLVSNALYWLREFHVDGLRVDAVASMLYLDYDRGPGEWTPNAEGNNHNLESIAFFRKLNSAIFGEIPDVLMIAEESTAWPLVTAPVSAGGLGFNFKWNMGWANDMFDYVETDPIFRKHKHHALNFSMSYAFSENFVLPVSHDEVVHGKRTLLDKMFGSYEEKFASARVFFAYMMAHPGKKLTFMGCEYGQFREWDYASELEWFMTNYETHATLRRFVARLNNLYLSDRRFYERDFSWEGFEWIYPDMADYNIAAFRRRDADGNYLDAVFNFSPVRRENFEIPAGCETSEMREILNTDASSFGGAGAPLSPDGVIAVTGGTYRVDLPAMSAVFLEPQKTVKTLADRPDTQI